MENNFVEKRLNEISLETLINVIIDNKDPIVVEEINENLLRVSCPELGNIEVEAFNARMPAFVETRINFKDGSELADSFRNNYEYHGEPLINNKLLQESIVNDFYQHFLNYITGSGPVKAAIREKLRQKEKHTPESATEYLKALFSDAVKSFVPDATKKTQLNDPFGIVSYVTNLKSSLPSDKAVKDAKIIAEKVDALVKERDALFNKQEQILGEYGVLRDCLRNIASALEINTLDEVPNDKKVYLDAIKALQDIINTQVSYSEASDALAADNAKLSATIAEFTLNKQRQSSMKHSIITSSPAIARDELFNIVNLYKFKNDHNNIEDYDAFFSNLPDEVVLVIGNICMQAFGIGSFDGAVQTCLTAVENGKDELVYKILRDRGIHNAKEINYFDIDDDKKNKLVLAYVYHQE